MSLDESKLSFSIMQQLAIHHADILPCFAVSYVSYICDRPSKRGRCRGSLSKDMTAEGRCSSQAFVAYDTHR